MVRPPNEDPDAAIPDTEWFYQEDGQVFGPVSTRGLLQRLYEGTLSADTPVALEDEAFQSIRDIGAFRSHLPKVAEFRAQRARAAAEAAAAARRRMARRAGWIVVGLVVVGLGSAGVAALVRHRRAVQAEAARKAREAALQAELDALMASVTIEPPLEALIDEKKSTRSSRRRKKSRRGRKGRVLSRREIMRGVRQVFGEFKHCIVQQIQRAPDSVRSPVVLTFTIANNGRARDVSFTDRFLRRSPMKGCFQASLEKTQWRTFRGEVRNVEYPISVRR